MITVKVDVQGLDATKARLRGLSEKKIAVAAVAALNDAAYLGAQQTRREMERVFDRPTPWVLGGVRYQKANRGRLESRIDFDKWGNKTNVTVEKVLAAQIYSGQRRLKRHEVALQRAGILPAGMAMVPAGGAKIDQYGNMSSAQIVQIIAWFDAFDRHSGDNKNMTDKKREALGRDKKKTGQKGFQYFALQRPWGKLGPGIYQRFRFGHGSAVKPIAYFVPVPTYRKRLDFFGLAQRAAQAEFERAFPRYLQKLLLERGL